MPCFLRGTIVVRDIDTLRRLCSTMGIKVIDHAQVYELKKGDNTIASIPKAMLKEWITGKQINRNVKKLIQSYSVEVIKKQARLKGWTAKISQDGDKIKVRLTK